MPILAHMAVMLVLGDRAALHGTSLLHRAGAHYPCPCPLLSLLHSHRCPLPNRTLSQGWWRGCLMGASTDLSEREQSMGAPWWQHPWSCFSQH